MSQLDSSTTNNQGFLGWVERRGNKLPDPVFIFFWLILVLIVISVIASILGTAALHPSRLDENGSTYVISVVSLLSPDVIRRLLVEMPTTFSHFHPLGYVLVVMLGAGVAERSGLFASAMRAAVKNAPTKMLTPFVALVAMMSNLAADASYVVLIPLAAVLYAAAGRHPIAGLATAFAGVSGGFSANLLPGQLDALLFGITEAAAESLAPSWDANIAGNWFFISAMTFIFLPIIWYVTDRIVEPRLGKFHGENDYAKQITENDKPLTVDEQRGLRNAGYAILAIIGIWVFLCFGPGTPLIDEAARPEAQLTPLYRSLIAGFLIMFLACGWAYGTAAGTVKNHRDIVNMMTEAMSDMAYYLVLAFAAAHFVALFNWSNLGLIFAIKGAAVIESASMPMPIILALLVLFTGLVNLFVGSASAKWALLAPVLVPMMMLTGISPEMTTAAYRVGDSATNIITPLMIYFPLILIFAQRWQKNYGLGSLTATMLPYSIGLLLGGLALIILWVAMGWPLGPSAPLGYTLPN